MKYFHICPKKNVYVIQVFARVFLKSISSINLGQRCLIATTGVKPLSLLIFPYIVLELVFPLNTEIFMFVLLKIKRREHLSQPLQFYNS